MRITREQIQYRFDKDAKPVLKTNLPAHLVFETKDAFSGQIQTENDVMDGLDYSIMNPITGPAYFENVEPGDVLEIHIDKITCASKGCALCVPGEGVIGHMVKEPKTRIYDISDNMVKISDNISLPIDPMIGVIGVAPADEKPLAMYPGRHGGNMDARLIKQGATLYLPVQVKGGLLSMGDLHAAQGDGESFYTGLEVAGEVEVTVNVRKDLKIDIPFVKSEGKFASIATAEKTDDALSLAMEKLVEFVSQHKEIDMYDAGFLCGLFANLEISQVVDPLKTARMSIDEKVIGL
ncbi:MAG: acetamidase/formamidase family protein [Clostridium sp.]